MSMDKCREAFEQIPEIKDSLSENIVFVGNKYTTANEGFYDLVNWLNGGWYTWQSRQAEVDALKNLLEIDEYAHNLYYENANLQTLVEEKDKWIEEALFQMRQQALSLKEDCDGYKDPVGICQSEGIDWCVRFLEKALQGFQGDRS